MARLSALACAALLVISAGLLYVTSRPGFAGGTEVRAEFRDVYPLLTGMDVREWGAPAGTVTGIELTDRGTVLVTMRLSEGTTPPRADATASIREQDITGDSYVDLAPGHAARPLGDAVIPPSRTLTAPRFDDLLNSFTRPVQQALQIVLVQLGMTLEARGADLNRAALALRPALAAADRALAELGAQNRTLSRLVADAERVSGQAAAQSRSLGRLVDSLDATLRATAAQAPALDRALAAAPATAARARRTLAGVRRLAVAGLPLARTLRRAAPGLARTASLLGPFLGDASAVLGDVSPTLAATRRLMVAATPTLRAAPKRVLTAPFDIAGAAGKLLSTLLAQRDVIRSLFGADGYGRGPRSRDDVGLGAIAVERGNQLGYPQGYDPERYFLRADPVPSCEMFGLPIRPGCLEEALAASRPAPAAGPSPRGGASRPAPAPRAAQLRAHPALPPVISRPAQRLANRLRDLLGGRGPLGRHRPPHQRRGGDGGKGGALGGLRDLLGYVLRP